MSTATLTLKKPARPSNPPAAYSRPAKPAKPSKRVIAEFWAKASGIVNTGETDLSTREGFGY